jgi:phage shock protein C
MVAGVAGGMAEYMNLDPAWVRIAWLAVLVMGPGLLLYFIAWIAIPEEPITAAAEPAASPTRHPGSGARLAIGAVLALVGGAMLVNEVFPAARGLIVPVLLIAVGTGTVVYAVRQ